MATDVYGDADDSDFSGSDQAHLQDASFFGDRLRDQLGQHPDVAANIRNTIGGIVGPQFTPQEIDTLQNRALDSARIGDVFALTGIQSGVPVTLTTPQWTVVGWPVAADASGRSRQTGLFGISIRPRQWKNPGALNPGSQEQT